MSKVFDNLPFDLMNIVNEYIFNKKEAFNNVILEIFKNTQWYERVIETPQWYDTVMFNVPFLTDVIKRYSVLDNDGNDDNVRHNDYDLIKKYTSLKTEYISEFLYEKYVRRAFFSKLSKFEIRYMINKEFEIIYNMVKKKEVLTKNKIKCKCGRYISNRHYQYHIGTKTHVQDLYNKKFDKLFNRFNFD